MEVTIRTDNGHMQVNLEEFLPAPAAKMRKLFMLMRNGLARQERLMVRTYLREKIKSAGASRDRLEKRQAELETELTKLDLAYAEIVKRRKDARGQLASVKGQMRKAGRVIASGASWVRTFDEICMGADLYVEDLVKARRLMKEQAAGNEDCD